MIGDFYWTKLDNILSIFCMSSVVQKKAFFSLVDENLVFKACPCEPDQNKKRERESTSRKPWALPAVAASVTHASPARVPAR